MDFSKAFEKATGLCARKEYCVSEMVTRLKKWETPEELIPKVIEKLKANEFLDEKRYARFFVRDKVKFNQWGIRKIAWALRQKQIPEDIAGEALAQINADDSLETLIKLLSGKDRTLKLDDPYKRKAALVRFAVSRGFDYEITLKVVERFL
jgi:regulatory protein